MNTHGSDPHAEDPLDHGVLDEAPGVDTAGIGILGSTGAHVRISLPADASDEDLVDDDEILEPDVPASRPASVADAGDPDESSVAAPETQPEPVSEQESAGEAVRATEPDPVAGAAPAREPAAASASAPESTVPATPPRAPETAASETAASETAAPATAAPAAAAPPVRRAPAPAAAAPTASVVPTSRRIAQLTQGAERETPDLLTPDRLLDPHHIVRPEPEGLWRHLVYSATRGRINLGDSARARARKDLDRRISAPMPGGGARFVAVLSRKGGVGKTTVTTLLGMALADARDDRVVAVDANPDRGTLAERITRRSGKTVRDLVRESEGLRGYNDVSAIVARDETRLDVLASDTDPHVSLAFDDNEYRAVARVAAHYYSVVLTDSGTGIVHSVMGATLDLSDQLVLVTGLSIDEARLASETLTWLESNGHEERARNALVVLNMSSPGSPMVRQDEVEAHFRSRVRDVVRIPYDPQLATGGAIVFRELRPATREAARELAVRVIDGLREHAPVG
ncbi:MinD/ParA family protein [Microbacterium sp. LRZ72]|uniref:MinD/ParA family protein n=1 Tax=Microbacterium sp. LRZ72 TaxID=2942481 RepID=UPI0029B52D6C|nr:MinD/ParA family protein [Microbacterium sp. LRZ72]MDX2377153.1 MinD/ParA family protein [Microbacterium sp. LRZ72]